MNIKVNDVTVNNNKVTEHSGKMITFDISKIIKSYHSI